MSDEAIADLQSRLTYQQASIDELTKQSLAQQQQIELLITAVEQLGNQLQDLAEQRGTGEIVDAPPPHY